VKIMRQKLFLSAALIGLAVGPALAQTSGTGTTGTSPGTTTQSPTMSQAPTTGGTTGSQSLAALPGDAIMGSRLSDMNVRNQQDENVGEIDDFVVDQQGKIHQVIIQTGGVLGMGGKKVALPWDQVRIDSSRRVAVVSMTQDQLKSMPEFKAPDDRRDRNTGSAPARSPAGGATGTGGAGGMGGTGTTRP
jgi:sporulation protein YlmC with PRC-barrel domain